MKLRPKYYGIVEPGKGLCYCGKTNGTVWHWLPRFPGASGMNAHTKCFRNLWKGES